jgi:RNA polymerase sigma-70 factor (ECF subfamily)
MIAVTSGDFSLNSLGMGAIDSGSAIPANPPPMFVTTHWSVVLAAAQSDTTQARAALAKLCQTYWFPLYAYVRRRGHSPADAEDFTQAFFLSLLQSHSVARADQSRGRFRSFLLGAMNHFLADEWAKARAQKRGGGQKLLSLDLAAAEHRFDLEPANLNTPDQAFDREWAGALLDAVLTRLENEFRAENKAALFDALKQTLTGASGTQPYPAIAAQLGMNEGAVRVAVHRLRKRYRELLRAEIADTVGSPEEVKPELKHLFRVLAGG